MRTLLALLFALCAVPAHAIHETVFAANAADAANNRLLANPPLPMLRYSPGKWKLAFSPYYFSATQDFTDQSPSGSFQTTGKYSGGGLGLSGSWAFAERWGLFIFGVGSSVTGKDLAYNRTANNPSANNLQVLGAKASAISLSGGIVHQFFGREESGFVLPVFAGILLKKYDYSHRVVETLPNGTVTSDYDISGSGVSPGLLLGAEGGIDIGKRWQVNPFCILGVLASSELDAKVKLVRVNTQPNNSNQNVNRLLSGEKVDGNTAFGGLGVNLLYRPWGVSVNLTSPFLPSFIDSDSHLDSTLFSVSWAFGPGR